MKWYESQWNISDACLLDLSEEYNRACEEMDRICYLFVKFEKTHNDKLIGRIAMNITRQYAKEKDILGKYAILIREWYCKIVLPQCFEQIL